MKRNIHFTLISKHWLRSLVTIFMTMLMFSTYSFAGGQDTGGGHVVACKGKRPMVLDYYNATLSGAKLLNVEDPNILNIIAERLEMVVNGFGSDFIRTYNEIGPVEEWSPARLKPVLDHNLIYDVPENCEILQAAAQQDGEMFQNPAVTKTLSAGQKTMLRIHETFYHKLLVKGQNSSMPVRNLLKYLLQTNLQEKKFAISWDKYEVLAGIVGYEVHDVSCSSWYFTEGNWKRSEHTDRKSSGGVISQYWNILRQAEEQGMQICSLVIDNKCVRAFSSRDCTIN